MCPYSGSRLANQLTGVCNLDVCLPRPVPSTPSTSIWPGKIHIFRTSDTTMRGNQPSVLTKKPLRERQNEHFSGSPAHRRRSDTLPPVDSDLPLLRDAKPAALSRAIPSDQPSLPHTHQLHDPRRLSASIPHFRRCPAPQVLMRPGVVVPEAELDELPTHIVPVHDAYAIQLPFQRAEQSLDTSVLPGTMRLYPLKPYAQCDRRPPLCHRAPSSCERVRGSGLPAYTLAGTAWNQ